MVTRGDNLIRLDIPGSRTIKALYLWRLWSEYIWLSHLPQSAFVRRENQTEAAAAFKPEQRRKIKYKCNFDLFISTLNIMLGGFLLHIVTYQWVCSLYTQSIALFQDCLIFSEMHNSPVLIFPRNIIRITLHNYNRKQGIKGEKILTDKVLTQLKLNCHQINAIFSEGASKQSCEFSW